MKKIKYDISYIRKNLDLKKFIEYLNSISKWSYQTDGTPIINSAIKACDSKKNKDPFPFKDIYHISNTLVDAATVVVTDLCENLSNSINVYSEDI